jgi:adenine-specific DNA glycosylase
VEDALVAGTPAEFRKDAHHWLILHGRYVCTARAPKCPTCIIRGLCEYQHKTPAPAKRTGVSAAIRRAGAGSARGATAKAARQRRARTGQR